MRKSHKRFYRFTAFFAVIALLCAAFLCLSSCENESSDPPEVNTYPLPIGGQPSDPDSSIPKKRVAMTFDDGPHTLYTKQIANELERYGFTATFFVIGNRADGTAYTDNNVLSFLAGKGQEIAIHGYTHDVYYHNCSEDTYNFELSKTHSVIKAQAPSADVKLMRPIGGNITKDRAAACPYSVIMWDVDSEDWRYKYRSGDTEEQKKQKLDTIVENVMSSVKDGSIILMHDIYESTYDATCIILERLNAEGYQVVSVSELLGDPKPGVTYRQAS